MSDKFKFKVNFYYFVNLKINKYFYHVYSSIFPNYLFCLQNKFLISFISISFQIVHYYYSNRFFWQYLDPDYVKRLQLNVAKNASKYLKDKSVKDMRSGPFIRLNEIQKQSNEIYNPKSEQKYNEGNSKCDISKFKSKMTTIDTKESPLPCGQTIAIPKLKLKSLHRSLSVENVRLGASAVTKIRSKTPQMKIQSQNSFDDIEITLAKITSSQRAICATIDSLL